MLPTGMETCAKDKHVSPVAEDLRAIFSEGRAKLVPAP